MTDIPPVIHQRKCPHCGASSSSGKDACWLCYQTSNGTNPYASSVSLATESEIASYEAATAWDAVFSLLLGICVLLTVLIAIGMLLQDRGMLLPFAILVGPAYLVTIVRGSAQAASGRKVRPGNLLLTFVVSGLVTVGVLVLLFTAAVVLLFLYCIAAAR